FGGPFPRRGAVGSGDALMRTIRLVAAALSGMTSAAHVAVNPLRGDEDAALARQALSKAMGALEEAAKDIHTHRAIGRPHAHDGLRSCSWTRPDGPAPTP